MENITKVLGLEKPVKITFSKKPHAAWDACYTPRFNKWGDIKHHRIKIYNNPDRSRSVEELIAHELIHAWQEENALEDIHGQPFQKMARKIVALFPDIPRVYDPELDSE